MVLSAEIYIFFLNDHSAKILNVKLWSFENVKGQNPILPEQEVFQCQEERPSIQENT